MNYGDSEFYTYTFDHNDAEKSWQILVESTVHESYKGQRLCGEALYRKKFGRLPGELSPEQQIEADKKAIEELKAKIAEAEEKLKVEPDPVKEVPVEVVIPPPIDPPVEEPKKRRAGRIPNAMKLSDLQPK
jgi:outer membrane protein assembly factor BamA